MRLTFGRFTFFLFALLANLAVARASNSGITYQGRILKPDGTPIAGQFTQFKMQIRTPDVNNCLMYEEIQSQDLRNANGSFSLTINDGTGSRTDSTGFNLDRIFGNYGSFSFNPATCSTGSTYLPNTGDGRSLVVLFKDETMSSWEPIPASRINFVPFAFEAKQVQGFTSDSLLRVVNASGDPITGLSPFSNAQYTELLAIIGGTTTQYTKAGQLNGVAMPAMGSSQVLGWNGSAWTSVDPVAGVQGFAKVALPTCSAGQFLKDNGSNAFTCVAGGGGGTVTQVNTGTGLTGGGFTTSGTISIAVGGVSATELAAGAVTNTKIGAGAVDTTQINAGAVTTAKLAADAVDSSKILDGTIVGADLNAAINITTTGTVATGMLTTRDFKLYPSSGSFKISMEAPTLTADYQLTWPASLPGSTQLLQSDSAGNLSWVAASSGSQWTTHATNISYDGGGRVGIGTTSPSQLLDVNGWINAASGYYGGGLWTNANDGVHWGSTTSVTGNGTSNYVMFTTSSTERMRIDTNGKVGIGTAGPTEKLDVNGAVRLGTTASMNAGTLRWNGTNFQGTDGSAWYNIMPNPPAAGGCDQTQTFGTAGTYGYTVPASFATITIKVWGGGGSGAGSYSPSYAGGASTVSSLGLSAGAGGPGSGAVGGAGGSGSGGTINTSGAVGTNGNLGTCNGGNGGTAPGGGGAGGAGGLSGGCGGWASAYDGAAPGGGGGGNVQDASNVRGGGGSGAYVEKTFTPGTLPPGTTINDIVVGAGGVAAAYGGQGGAGRVSVVCSTTGTPSTIGWGSCSIGSFTAASGANTQPCTGVIAGSPISCSPAAAPSTATVTWGARASAADTVVINASGAFGTATNWKCMFMNP